MRQREITFVSHTAAPGGAELALSRYLRATQLPVGLVTMAEGAVWDDLPCPVTVAPSLRQVASALRRHDGPVVANSMRAAFYAALVSPRRRPLVYWVRDGLTNSAMSGTALRLTRQVTARRVTAYLANSEWTAGTVRDALGVERGRLHVVHSMCGVGEEMSSRRPRAAPHDPVRLLFLGRIAPWKAPDIAVRALACLRERGVGTTLTVAGGTHFGEDSYAQELRAAIATEPAASVLGHVDDVHELLDSHDILVHCSTVPEPFGQVIVQALAAGLPVVATDQGGPREILGNGAGWLVPPGDPDVVAAAVEQIVVDYRAASEDAIGRAAAFADAAALQRTDTVLHALAARASRPGRRQGARGQPLSPGG